MTTLRLFGSANYWKHGFSGRRAIAGFFSALGAMWLVVQVTDFASPSSAAHLRQYWAAFLIGSVIWGVWQTRPRSVVRGRLNGRDTWIEIRVGDVLKQDADLIIGSNFTFDTDTASGLISPRSVQGQFTAAWYDDVRHLDQDLDAALEGMEWKPADCAKPGKSKQYNVGTVARVHLSGRNAYLVAIAKINEHGSAHGSFEDLQVALASTWEFIAARGDRNALAMPVLGTGFARLPQARADVVREIINSFIAGCTSQTFCERLVIVIPSRDFYSHDLDIDELGSYLRHVCRYTQYLSSSTPGMGTPIS